MITQTTIGEQRLLLVEDDESQAVLVRELLGEAGWLEPTWVTSVREAFEACDENVFDAILLDLGLIDSNGLETLRSVLPRVPHTPVIVLTAYAEEEIGAEAIQLGAADYIHKGELESKPLSRLILYAIGRRMNVSELIRRQEDLELLTRAAAHDLKAPLRNFNTLIEMFLEDTNAEEHPELEPHLHYLHTARASAAKLSDRVDALLRLARMGVEKFDPAPLDLDGVAREVVDGLEHADRIEIGPLPRVHADQDLMASLLQNLIENGLKYSEGEPRVKISGERRGGLATVTVSDEGIGMSDHFVERAFEAFSRGVSDPRFAGHGLGLAICRRIIELHRGSIELESEAGEGTTVRFTIPAAD